MYQAKAASQPNTAFIDRMVYLLTYGVSLLVFTLLVAAYRGAIKRPVMALVDQYRGRKEQTVEGADAAAVSIQAPEVVETASAIWETPEIVASQIRRIEFHKKGYVVFSYYEKTGEVKGKLTVTSRATQKVVGKMIVLRHHSAANILDATAAMKAQAEAVLSAKNSQEVGHARQASDTAAQDSIPEWVTEMPSWDGPPPGWDASPPDSHEYANVERECDGGNPSDHHSAPVVHPEPVRLQKKLPSKQADVTYQGILTGYGFEDRTMDDPKSGEKRIRQFCVRIHDQNLQAENQLWGNDLQRVITEAKVQVGERVELGVVGQTPVMVRGKPRNKKVWTLKKV